MGHHDSPDRSGARRFLRVMGGSAIILSCALAVLLLSALAELVVPGLLIHGREFRPAATVAAVLIGLAGLWLHGVRRHELWEMLAALAVVEVVVIAAIAVISGSASPDRFFLSWFLGINQYLAVPWLGALGLILVFRSLRSRISGS